MGVIALAQLLERLERAAVDRDHVPARDDQVHLAQQRTARARAGIDAVGDHEHVVLVLLELRALAELARILDRQRMQVEQRARASRSWRSVGALEIEPEEPLLGDMLARRPRARDRPGTAPPGHRPTAGPGSRQRGDQLRARGGGPVHRRRLGLGGRGGLRGGLVRHRVDPDHDDADADHAAYAAHARRRRSALPRSWRRSRS